MSNLNGQQICQLSHNSLVGELAKRNLSTSGVTDLLKIRLIRNCERNGQQPIRQPFDLLAVIDFEATCVANAPRPPHPYIQEIIEFPVVLIDVAKETIVETFHSYCRPVLQPVLSDYCKQLTGITQKQVNNAPPFIDVFTNVEKWLNDRDLLSGRTRTCLFVTDSPSDFNKYLRMQCEIAHIVYPKWGNQWINVKITFSRFYSIRSGRIRNMLETLGLGFHGHLHSGIDDATNIGRIVIELIKDGCVLMPNEFYNPLAGTVAPNPQLPNTRWNSSRMICLNCSRSHSEDQRSCVQCIVRQRRQERFSEPKRRPVSQHGRFHSNQPANIPSLLNFPSRHVSNRFSGRRFRSSHLSDTENNMDCT